jgi:hypothetical protein
MLMIGWCFDAVFENDSGCSGDEEEEARSSPRSKTVTWYPEEGELR